MAESIWGPSYEQYSQRKFEPRILEISEDDTIKFDDTYRAPPLAFLENFLCQSIMMPLEADILDLSKILGAIENYLFAIKDTKVRL